MSTILFLTGSTRGDALGSISRGVMHHFAQFGLDPVEINFAQPDASKTLERTLHEKNVLFALSYAGIGRDIEINDDRGKPDNLWNILGIPLINALGDSPAYYFDRHINPGPGFACLYAFREHYEFRKSLPQGPGMYGLALPFIFDREPEENIDFAAKEKGRLLFPKNGNDPKKLKEFWKQRCRPGIAQLLEEIGDILAHDMHNNVTNNIDGIVREYLGERAIDIDQMPNIRLFFVAQLDDYLRRVKTTRMAEVLRDFPIDIRGENWDHVDFSGRKCSFVNGCDYAQTRDMIRDSLGVIDMSPNTENGFHDRILRAYGMHTLCLTNQQQCLDQTFGENPEFAFELTEEGLRDRIDDVLARPKHYVELGREVPKIFDAHYPVANVVNSFLDIADLLRLEATKQRPVMQDFFVWPPTMGKKVS